MNDENIIKQKDEEIEKLKSQIEILSQKSSKSELLLSVEELPIGIYKSTLNGEILYANRRLLEILDFNSLEELRKYNAKDFYVFPESRDRKNSKLLKYDFHSDEFLFYRRDSSTIWVRDISKKVVDENGIEYYEGTLEDITDKAIALNNLKESEEKFRNLIETMVQGVALHKIILDDNGHPIDYIFLEVNTAFERLTGLERNRIIGKRVLEVLPNTEHYWIREYGKVAVEGKTTSFVNYAIEIDKYFDIVAFSPRKDHFAVVFTDITDKKFAEESLKDSEIKLRTLIDSLPDAVIFKDAKGRWLESNKFNLQLFQLEGVDYKGRTDAELADFTPFYSDALLTCQESDEIAWNNAKISKTNEIIPKPDGSFSIFDVTKIPIFDDDNERKGLVVLGRDITEQKEMEFSLRKSEHIYRTLINTSPDVITVINSIGKLIYISPLAAEMFGLKEPNEALGLSPFNFIAPSDVNKAKAMVMKINRTKQTHKDEYLLVRKDGKTFYGEVSAALLQDENNKANGMIFITRDITERKKAEEALKKSEEQYRIISELISDYVYSGTLSKVGNTTINWTLGGFENLTGYTFEQVNLLPGGYPSIVYKKDLLKIRDYVISELSQMRDVEVEYRLIHKSGKLTWIKDSIKPIRFDDDNQKLLILGAVKDITIAKEAEEALIETSQKLKELNEQKDRFFSIIAHDLKSPMSNFIGLSKMIVEQINEMDKDELEECTQNMLRSATNVFQLLENLLEWSKVQRNRCPFNPDIASLDYLINYQIDFAFAAYLNKNISLIADIKDNIFVKVDIQMFNTILRNLLSNALKFTPRGGNVKIIVEKIDDLAKISVQDSGIGISQENINKLFDIGHKVSRPGTENEHSSGLGLLLCKDFVQMNNGKIWVESTIGVGSTFNFTIPLAELSQV